MLKFFVVVGFALISGAYVRAEEPASGSLQWYAAKAKAEGKTSLRIHPPSGIPVELRELNQAIEAHMIVVAVPTAKIIDTRTGEGLWTWYKLRIEETLKVHPRPEEYENISPPDRLFPFKRNEIAVALTGGVAKINDVELTVPFAPIKELILGDQYLFFIIPANTRRYGSLNAGRNAVFKISPDGLLTPHDNPRSDQKEPTLFQENLLSRTGANLGSLRVLVTQMP